MENTKDTNKSIGTFEVESGAIHVSDPCYDLFAWCSGTLKNVQNGTWEASIVRKSVDGWGIRNCELIAHPEGIVPGTEWEETIIDGGVDSGQLGFYDLNHYKKHEDIKSEPEHNYGDNGEWWYGANCDVTLEGIGAGVIPFGCVSSSGYGDGSYPIFIQKDTDGKIIAIKAVFIGDKEEECEDYDDEDYCDEENES